MSPLAAEIVAEASALEGLAAEWWTLWRSAPAATPFQSPAWLLAWWRAFVPGHLATIVVRERGHLVGLAPLYLERARWGTRLLPLGIGASDYLDVLAAPGREPEVGASLAAAAAGVDGWSTWLLTNLAPDALARRLPAPAGCRAALDSADVCPRISLPQVSLDLAAVVPAGQRRKLRMAHHRLARHGAWRILATADLGPGQWLDQLTRLHARRWQSRGEAGVLADPRMQHFLSLALPALATHDLLRCFAIEAAGGIAGVHVGFVHGTCTYAWLGGIDPEKAHLSPGAVLIGHAIETAMHEGHGAFDFLRGAEAYKYGWGAVDQQTSTLAFRRIEDA